MVTTDERRRAQRFPLALPLEVKWHENHENCCELHKPATIRDISTTGVYFLFDCDLPADSKVEFYVRLQVEGAPGGVMLHCTGSIVRVEPTAADSQRVGVAARIERYRFLRPGEASPEIAPKRTASVASPVGKDSGARDDGDATPNAK